MKLSAYQRIVFGFIVVILVGTLLLSLPIAQIESSHATLLDHLFIATSMVCVTGLSTVAVASTYNFFGQFIGVCLMQIGGLGWLTIISLSVLWTKDKMALKDQFLLQEAINRQTTFKLKDFIKRLLQLTLFVESIAAIVLMFEFIPKYGIQGIWHSIFIAVSAFCNAGFDNFGASSLQLFITNPIVNFVVALLIIFGGLGFSVWYEIIDWLKLIITRNKRLFHRFRFSHHVRMVLQATFWLLLIGTIVTVICEYHNPNTLGPLSFFDKLVASFFQSATMRTAGFATVDYAQTLPTTNFVYILLMIIGGAPGGTAGGIKVTTLVVLVLLMKSIFKGHEQVEYQYRRLSMHIIKQALVILVFFMVVLLGGYFVLLITNPHLNPLSLWFESVSALATVGVSMGITSQLSLLGKLVIMLMMFIGRIGPITVLLSIGQQHSKEVKRVKTKILMG
ncbi:TrkH family potassium uptake protein [Carnobacteriaceae bacterium zg-ZUI252]|nr:TrkH family potassium uptake protein [Carnobacteriaceae bacterium zg-ZUI252]